MFIQAILLIITIVFMITFVASAIKNKRANVPMVLLIIFLLIFQKVIYY